MLQPEKHKPGDTHSFVTLFGSDLVKMKSFKWNSSFLVDRLVFLSAAGYKDVIPIRTRRMC